MKKPEHQLQTCFELFYLMGFAPGKEETPNLIGRGPKGGFFGVFKRFLLEVARELKPKNDRGGEGPSQRETDPDSKIKILAYLSGDLCQHVGS